MNKIILFIIFLFILPVAIIVLYQDYRNNEYQCKSPQEIDYERYQHIVDWSVYP